MHDSENQLGVRHLSCYSSNSMDRSLGGSGVTGVGKITSTLNFSGYKKLKINISAPIWSHLGRVQLYNFH